MNPAPLRIASLLASLAFAPANGHPGRSTAAASPAPAAQQQQAAPRVRLAPEFRPGQVLRYQAEFRTRTESRTAGPVADPQAGSALELNLSLRVRLEVLDPVDSPPAGEAAGGAGPAVRIRATYEQAAAVVKSAEPDPYAAEVQQWYGGLEGRSLEVFLGAERVVTDLSGLGEMSADPRAATAQQWLTQLLRGVRGPAEGAAPGQKWAREEAAPNAPLAGLVWRTETTYLRDEPCRMFASPEETAPPAEERCAVLLTRFVMERAATGDPTPPEYRARGLRTSGKLSGTGQGLSYVSLASGLVVGATQTAAEEMDLVISSADGGRVNYTGRVSSTSHIRLLAEPRPSSH